MNETLLTNMYSEETQMKTAKEQIIEAFLKLLINKNFEDLYVKDIVLEARISRSTFYLHYTDKFQLLEEVRKQLNGQFLKFYTGHSEALSVTDHICRHIFIYQSFYSREFSDAVAIHHLSDQLAVHMLHVYKDSDYAIFASYGTIGYLSAWVNNGFQGSTGEAAEKLMKIGFTNWAESIPLEADKLL